MAKREKFSVGHGDRTVEGLPRYYQGVKGELHGTSGSKGKFLSTNVPVEET